MPFYSLGAWAIDGSSPLDPELRHGDSFLPGVPILLHSRLHVSLPRVSWSSYLPLSLGFHVRACLVMLDWDFRNVDLTRFNKIAIQGTPQMTVDKEAILCLLRVYSYYFKCNLPLFYVTPPTRYLKILTLLVCTHSSDNLFHTLMVLCENENFLTSNLLCFPPE